MTTLLRQHWMTEPATRAVMEALTGAGGDPRFVGGCVRNALMAREVADIDIATPLTPDAVIAALTDAGLKAIPTGIDHGTVTALADGKQFEVTTLRKDVSTDGRHAVVAFTTDWVEDASRRDFTINAIYAGANGQIFDPTGDGVRDLATRRVRFIGDANARIQEDYLRILRFFRIHAWYGEGSMDEAGLAACAAHTKGLAQLSGERIQKEMLKLLSAEEPIATLRAMAATGVLIAALPGPLNIPRLESLAAIDRDAFTDPDGVLRLAALLSGADGQCEWVTDRWRLSNKDASRVAALNIATPPKIVPYLSIKEVRRTLYRIGADRFIDFCRLRWAEDKKASNQMNWRAMIAMAQSWSRPVLQLTGHQLIQAGVPAGPEIGRVMAEIEEWWIDTDFTNDEFSIIERLKAIVQASHWG